MQLNYLSALLLHTLPLAIAGGGRGSGRGHAHGDIDASNKPFRIISYDAAGIKQYFTQPAGPTEPYKLYQTSDISKSETFHLDGKNHLWYDSPNPELPGPLYSFYYPDTLTPPPAIAYAGFFTAWFIDDPIFAAEYNIWKADFRKGSLMLIRPAGLVMVTCAESLADGTPVNVWYVATVPFTPSAVCREISLGIECVE